MLRVDRVEVLRRVTKFVLITNCSAAHVKCDQIVRDYDGTISTIYQVERVSKCRGNVVIHFKNIEKPAIYEANDTFDILDRQLDIDDEIMYLV